MKLFKKLGLAAALATSLIAGQAIAQSALDEILSDGILKVGTTGDWNPMSVRDPATNKYVGYDIDIMTELAKDLGVELELVPTDWKTLVNGVVAGKYHMTGSASISPPRLKAAGYSDSYISVEILPFTTADKIGQFDSWASVKIPVGEARAPTPIAMLLPQRDQVWINYVNSWIELKKAKGFFEATASEWGL